MSKFYLLVDKENYTNSFYKPLAFMDKEIAEKVVGSYNDKVIYEMQFSDEQYRDILTAPDYFELTIDMRESRIRQYGDTTLSTGNKSQNVSIHSLKRNSFMNKRLTECLSTFRKSRGADNTEHLEILIHFRLFFDDEPSDFDSLKADIETKATHVVSQALAMYTAGKEETEVDSFIRNTLNPQS